MRIRSCHPWSSSPCGCLLRPLPAVCRSLIRVRRGEYAHELPSCPTMHIGIDLRYDNLR